MTRAETPRKIRTGRAAPSTTGRRAFIKDMTKILSDKKFSIQIQGCRTNQYEGEAIAAALEACGARRDDESPDIVVIVTCAITAVADRKCRKLIRRARREHPNAVIAACGCSSQKMTARDAEELGLDIAIGNRRKYTLPRLVAERLAGAPRFHEINEKIMTDESWDALSLDRPRLHTRAFLKVQDGCAHYCAYCIVPFVRGKPVSRPMDEAVEEARRITESGCPEIVLTGIHLGLYENLPELVRRIGALPKLRRLRFGSIEPFAVDEALLSALADTPAFCEHLHMPLQSGDAGVLADMRRGYAPEEFAKVAERARAALGDELHISTDLMIGFPTESRAAFRNSMNFIKSVEFGKIHVFPYSPRSGTKAAAMPPVPEAELKERTAEALEAAAELHEKFCVRRLGRDITILTEEIKNGAARGLTRNYIRAEAPAGGARVNEELTLTPARYADETLFAAETPSAGFSEEISVI